MSIVSVLVLVFTVCIFLRTLSYGIWTWKRKNRLGGAMVIFLGCAVVLSMVCQMFFE